MSSAGPPPDLMSWAIAVRRTENCSDGVNSSEARDRKSTRLNSSHSQISYAVFCLKKKKTKFEIPHRGRLLGSNPIQVPGQHNDFNALSAGSLHHELESPLVLCRQAVAAFPSHDTR